MLRITTLRSWEGRSPLVDPEEEEEAGPIMRVRLIAQAVMSSRKNMDSRCWRLLWGIRHACTQAAKHRVPCLLSQLKAENGMWRAQGP